MFLSLDLVPLSNSSPFAMGITAMNETRLSTFFGRSLPFLIFAALLAAWCLRPALASGRASLSLTSSPEIILADGKSTTTVTATVRDGDGNVVPDGTVVRFSASLGLLDKDTAPTTAGVARATLTSAATVGTAQLTATAFLTGAGSSAGAAHVEFTSDREEAYSNGDEHWIHMDCPEYLIYSADSKTLEAQGRKGSAHLQYKGLSVNGDALQVSLNASVLLGHNVVLQRGHHTLRAAEIRYDLNSNTGSAVVLGTGRHAALSMDVSGLGLETTPQQADSADAAVQTNIYRFDDLSDSKVIVSARAISVNPGDRLQFRRASIYSGGKKILSVPYHQMSLNSEQLFGQQLVGFGSQGLFVNVPIYYNVSPHSTGTLFLRNSASAYAETSGLSSGGSYFSQHGSRPGLALDLQHDYSFGRGGSGSLGITGITRPDWGVQWNHTQRLDDKTNSFLYVDYPSHRSLYASSSLSREFKGFALNLTANGNRDPGFKGYAYANSTMAASLQTTPRSLAGTPINMTFGVSAQRGQVMQTTPDQGKVVTPISTQSLDMHFYTAPLHPDRHTTISNGLSLGQSFSSGGRHSMTLLGTLGAARTTFGHGNLNLNYTYRYDPLQSQLSTTRLTANNLVGSFYRGPTQQRLTLNYTVSPRPRMNLSLISGYGLPLHDNNLFANFDYRISDNWGISLASSWDHYASANYQETQVSLTRRLLGRDVVFTYSTKTRKVIFDLAASGL